MKVILKCILLLFLAIESTHLNQQIKVEVLYESLCPDSVRFINDQLYPAWKDVAQYVQIKFVPFGFSSSSDDKVTFECQHGPRECKGNRIQSCALNGLDNANDQVKYVNCFMKIFYNGDEEELGETCAKQVGLDWNNVIDCYKTDKGILLQLEAEKETAKFPPSFIPSIIYNDVFDQERQDASITDFKGVVLSLVNDQN